MTAYHLLKATTTGETFVVRFDDTKTTMSNALHHTEIEAMLSGAISLSDCDTDNDATTIGEDGEEIDIDFKSSTWDLLREQ